MEYQNINENKNQKKEHDFRNIALTIVGLFVILAAVSGGTFAYYSFGATNSGTVSGTAANANITLSVEKVSTDANGPLVPQLTTTLNKAIVGTSQTASKYLKCVDGNGNTVCQIYKITVTNGSTAIFNYKLNISFSGGTFSNLKWTTISEASYSATNATSVTPGTTSSATSLAGTITGSKLAASTAATHYIVVWIAETGSAQNTSDTGTFTGTVSLTDDNGNSYLTSTFTA